MAQQLLPAVQRPAFTAVEHVARATPWLHTPARLWAVDGIVAFAGLLLLGWWVARRSGDQERLARALWAPLGVLIAVAVNQPLVHALAQPRPYTVFPHALVLVARSTDPSFPSDHATMAGAVAVGVLMASRRLGVVAVLAALLLAFARVYVGAHFPLDVVAGLLLGGVVTGVGYLLVRPLLTRLLDALAHTPLRPLVSVSPV